MTIKVYIDWPGGEVLSEKEYTNRVNEKMKEIMEDESELSDFLDNNYSTGKVYCFTAKERAEVDKQFAKHCKEVAEDWMREDFSEHSIEI